MTKKANKIIQEMKDKFTGQKKTFHPSSILQELEDTHARHQAEVAASDLLKQRLTDCLAKIERLENKLRAIEMLVSQIVKM